MASTPSRTRRGLAVNLVQARLTKNIAVKQRRMPPQRTCVSCRGVFDKRQLNRVVRTPIGEVTLDPGGKMSGRGAYLCSNPECWTRAIKSQRLEKALNYRVPAQALALVKEKAESLKEEAVESASV